MALISKSLALVSVGISCQAAFQMRHNLGLIEEISGESFEEHATPFDWLLCDVSAPSAMLRERTFYPRDLAELTVNGGKPYWNRYGVHFWHHKLNPKNEANREAWLSRAAHCVDNWNRIGESVRRVFVLSNAARANVERALADREGVNTSLDFTGLVGLAGALAGYLGRIELHVITPQDGDALRKDELARWNVTIHGTQAGTPGNWKGSVPFWHRFFRKVCG